MKHFRTIDGGYIAISCNYPVYYERDEERKDLDMPSEEKIDEEAGKTFCKSANQGLSVFVPENVSEDSLKM